MTKRIVKIMAVVLMAVIITVSLSQVVFASMSLTEVNIGKVTSAAKDTSGAASSINNLIGAALTIVQVVGVGVAVIMLVVLAIKYISAAPGDKAEIKKHAVVYVIGAIVLFAASGILGIVRNLAKNISANE